MTMDGERDRLFSVSLNLSQIPLDLRGITGKQYPGLVLRNREMKHSSFSLMMIMSKEWF